MPLNSSQSSRSSKPSKSSNKKKAGVVVIVAAGCLASAGAVAVAAPALRNSSLMPDAVSEHVFKEKTRAFATAADAPTKGDLAFVLPEWIPRDAENVKVKVKTTGEAKLIRFTLADGQRLAPERECGARARHVAGPELDAPWWPDRTPSTSRGECGDHYRYRVAVQGDTVYAWTNGEASADG
ncbi:hypothetical protein [Streptomyces formicae]|uniref:hypothetical protein n=1 Tax=Streptomyces formicae TaxID=1616117 RepID=UPI00131CB7C9|nr:hypothetical protein [Streptomyces formicae]